MRKVVERLNFSRICLMIRTARRPGNEIYSDYLVCNVLALHRKAGFRLPFCADLVFDGSFCAEGL